MLRYNALLTVALALAAIPLAAAEAPKLTAPPQDTLAASLSWDFAALKGAKGCPCGPDCKCTAGQSCGCVQAVSVTKAAQAPDPLPGPLPFGYWIQRERAILEDRPLLVFVGVPAQAVPGCLNLTAATFPGFTGTGVVVGVPRAGELWRSDLAGVPTPQAILQAVTSLRYPPSPAPAVAPFGVRALPASSAGASPAFAPPVYAAVPTYAPIYGGFSGGGISFGRGSCGPGGCP